jgi:hypothetical protein
MVHAGDEGGAGEGFAVLISAELAVVAGVAMIRYGT